MNKDKTDVCAICGKRFNEIYVTQCDQCQRNICPDCCINGDNDSNIGYTYCILCWDGASDYKTKLISLKEKYEDKHNNIELKYYDDNNTLINTYKKSLINYTMLIT